MAFSIALWAAIATLAAETPPPVPIEDYGRFERTSRAVLSKDGRWLAYRIDKVDRSSALFVSPTEPSADPVETADERRFGPFADARDPVFANDSSRVLMVQDVDEVAREAMAASGEPVETGIVVLDLHDGQTHRFDQVAKAAFDDSGRFIFLQGYAAAEPAGRGADLTIVDLVDGAEVRFAAASEAAWSDAGSLLALTTATRADGRHGIQVYDAENASVHLLETGDAPFRGLSWREDSADLAVYRSTAAGTETPPLVDDHAILVWRDLDADHPSHFSLDRNHPGFAIDHRISHRTPITWSDTGESLAFGARPEFADEIATPGDAEDLPGVQIWHAADKRIYPRQAANQEADRARALLALWHLGDDRVVRLGSQLDATVEILEGWRTAIERLDEAYGWGARFGRPYHDLDAIDLDDGSRRRIAERVRFSWASATGRYLVWFDGEYQLFDLQTNRARPLTREIDAEFADQEYDYPTDLRPPYGYGGWLDDDKALFVHDRHDVWRITPQGRGERLTNGATDGFTYRVIDLDDEEVGIAPDEVFLSAWNQSTEARGFARIPRGRDRAIRLMTVDQLPSGFAKAEDADTFVLALEAANRSRDYFATDSDLEPLHRITSTNAFLEEYAWTHTELVDFTSDAGLDLQAAIAYPVDYDPTKRYPMIVYTYEQLSQTVHQFWVPDERRYYNPAVWTQRGYFVLMPDIVYRARDPGVSAIESVRPAIDAAIAGRSIDRDRVGLIGHSWGGYQAAYLATRTSLFAAVVSGAPLTDFVSFMGQIHWKPGVPEVTHWETGQARMAVPFWEDPQAHRRNSPLHGIEDLDTPLLMAHGNADGVVEFFQASVFYNFARRAAKDMVLLVYEDEDHGFTQKANQIDYHRRILEWFDHYLRDADAPSWITDGIAFRDHASEKRRVAGVPPPLELVQLSIGLGSTFSSIVEDRARIAAMLGSADDANTGSENGLELTGSNATLAFDDSAAIRLSFRTSGGLAGTPATSSLSVGEISVAVDQNDAARPSTTAANTAFDDVTGLTIAVDEADGAALARSLVGLGFKRTATNNGVRLELPMLAVELTFDASDGCGVTAVDLDRATNEPRGAARLGAATLVPSGESTATLVLPRRACR